METNELKEGTRIGERYQIVRKLGGGGSALTYLGREMGSQHSYAIKVFTLKGAAWKSFELFEREAAVLARLSHPQIPRFVESFTLETEAGPTFCLVETFIDGTTLLAEALRGHLDEQEARKLADELLAILEYLQGLTPPVVHRDIKPANVLRTHAGKVALVDFGSVRAKDATHEGAATTIVGTFGFMAPEQYRGLAVPATDLYGVAATLVFLLTGQSPDQLPHEKLRPQLPSTLRLSPAFSHWLSRALEPAPEDRWQNAAEARRALAEDKAPAPPRNRRPWLLGAALVALLGVGGVVWWLDPGPTGAPPAGSTLPTVAGPPPQGRLLPMPPVSRYIDIKEVASLAAHSSGVSCVAESPDGKWVLSGGWDRVLKLTSTDGWSTVHSFRGHEGTVFGCGFSADGKHVVSAGGRSLRVFDVSTGGEVAAATTTADVHGLAVHGPRVLVGMASGEARSWALPFLLEAETFPLDGSVIAVAISADGSRSAYAGTSGVAHLTQDSAAARALAGHTGPISGLTFSPDGNLLASAGDDGTVRLWTTTREAPSVVMSGSPNTEAWHLAWSSDGGTLYVGDKAGTVTAFRMPQATIRWRWETGKHGPVGSLALSKDDKRLYTGWMNGRVQVFSVGRRAGTATLPKPQNALADGSAAVTLAEQARQIYDDNQPSGRILDQVEALANKALEANPRDALAMVQKARVVRSRGYRSRTDFEVGAVEEALKLLDNALALQPNLVDALAFSVRIHVDAGEARPEKDAGRFAGAEQALAKLLAVEPDGSRAFELQARLANAQKRYADGRSMAVRAVELATTKREAREAYLELAEALIGLVDLDGAEGCYRRALDLRTDSGWDWGNFAGFLRTRGHMEESHQAFQKALGLMDYPALHRSWARLHEETGIDALWSWRKPAAARKAFELALEKNPSSAVATYGLAATELYETSQKGQPCVTCVAQIEAALRLQPEHKTITAALAALKK